LVQHVRPLASHPPLRRMAFRLALPSLSTYSIFYVWQSWHGYSIPRTRLQSYI
jgi:hypothetical protein